MQAFMAEEQSHLNYRRSHTIASDITHITHTSTAVAVSGFTATIKGYWVSDIELEIQAALKRCLFFETADMLGIIKLARS